MIGDFISRWLERGREHRRALEEKIEEWDSGHREARHDIRGIQSQTDYLRSLIERMQGDRTGGEGRNANER